MTSILLLPLVQVSASVSGAEDLIVSMNFMTPLTGITLTSSIFPNGQPGSPIATLSVGSGITIGGAEMNELAIFVPASQANAWPSGIYAWTMTATDGALTREVFATSSLVVGASGQPIVNVLAYGPPVTPVV